MANNIIAQVSGGSKQVVDNVETISALKAKLNLTGYTAFLNGAPAEDSETLTEGDRVTLAVAAKGGMIAKRFIVGKV